VQKDRSGGSRELGKRWSLCGCQKNARVPIGQIHPGASSLRTTARTTFAKSSLLTVENSPDYEGLFVFRPTQSSHRPCGGPLQTVNIGVGGLSGRTKTPTYSSMDETLQHIGHACIICTAGHVLVEIDRRGRADSLITNRTAKSSGEAWL
jgi:hypothetical protein